MGRAMETLARQTEESGELSMDNPPEVTQEEWDTIIASDMTFREVEAKWGGEVAIEAGS